MAVSNRYDRAVGYFSSHGLALAAKGIHRLLANNGHMRLVASPVLNDDDLRAIASGYQLRADKLRELVSREFGQLDNVGNIAHNRLNGLAWLISEGRLEIKLAIRVDAQGRLASGLYHEKIGIFSDAHDQVIGFTGSSNETSGGLVDNFESVRVLLGWEGTTNHAREIAADFQALWSDRTPGARVLDFTACSQELLARYRQPARPVSDVDEQIRPVVLPQRQGLAVPPDLELRPHQTAACEAWLKADGRGIFSMATGAGKTIAALTTAARLVDVLLTHRHRLAVVLIVCPYRHLVTQWRDEAVRFGVSMSILAFDTRDSWFDHLQSALLVARSLPIDAPATVIIATNATLEGEPFQSLLPLLPAMTLVIADECHHLGAKRLFQSLPSTAIYRLGLSATPERWGDIDGTERLYTWFGKPLEPAYGLREALIDGVLTPYRYEPIFVHLDAEENIAYGELSQRIAQRIASGCDLDDEALGALLRKRTRIIALARAKLPALVELVRPLRHAMHHALIYCGEGSQEDGSERMVQQVVEVLGNDLGMAVATYTAESDLEQRDGIRRQLDNGALQAVVAMRCLDEGVDIPSVQMAIIMASSTNPRQFIQRRGRVLRRHPGKDRARIVDLVVCPAPEAVHDDSTRKLLRSELRRMSEFAILADNYGEVEGLLVPIRKAYEVWNA